MDSKYIIKLLEENNAKTELILRKVEAIVTELYSLSATLAGIESGTSEGGEEVE